MHESNFPGKFSLLNNIKAFSIAYSIKWNAIFVFYFNDFLTEVYATIKAGATPNKLSVILASVNP